MNETKLTKCLFSPFYIEKKTFTSIFNCKNEKKIKDDNINTFKMGPFGPLIIIHSEKKVKNYYKKCYRYDGEYIKHKGNIQNYFNIHKDCCGRDYIGNHPKILRHDSKEKNNKYFKKLSK